MSDNPQKNSNLPPDQQAIRAKCVHPTGTFVEFTGEELEQSISDCFEQIVAKYPDRIAVKTERGALRYRELNNAANRVARIILAKLGKEQEPVGLLFENGVQAITMIFGVLKAGKFYVPLDPSFPHGRIASILEDSGARLLVTDNDNAPLAGELTRGSFDLLNVDIIEAGVSDENLSISLSPENFACIIYTSGSTGEPKGVVQNHRCLLHWAMIYANDLHITPDDRLTLLHSLSVAACFHHFLGSLLKGATLFPCDPRSSGGAQLVKWLIHEQVTMYHSVPMVFRQMVAALKDHETFPYLRTINLSGAPMVRTDVELYKRYFSSECILLHMMGTTENGWVRRCFIDKATHLTGSAVPVGYPVEDTEVVLLDEDGGEVGFGQVGEIAVKSRYLASAYWRKSELTEAKFVSCSNEGNQRIYITGDLGRMEPDGCLFHLGRKDFQVKIRGFRVEISEVEAALLKHPAVKEGVVLGRKVPSGDTQLVAYFVPAEGPAPTVTELGNFLKQRLPDYMIPSSFVVLLALPITPNGKLDYGALPNPKPLRPELEAAYLAPKTEVERRIATVWQAVLGVEKVGVHDNFFDLGGHSLLLAEVQSKLQHILQRELPIIDLFKCPTIHALVEYVGHQGSAEASLEQSDALVENLRQGKNRLKRLSQRRQRTRENQ